MGELEGSSGEVMDCFYPGMIHCNNEVGRYPAISITGKNCELMCLHCKGSLLQNMIDCSEPEILKNTLKKIEKENIGALISGGCDKHGRLPWERFLPFLKDFQTSLYLTAHTGMNVSIEVSKGLKDANFKQGLIDIIGDEETLKEIYNLEDYKNYLKTLDNLFEFGPQIVPHIVTGIYWGKIKGEYEAIKILERYNPLIVVIVVIMPKLLRVDPPPIDEVIDIFYKAKERFKIVSLGCAKPRGKYRFELEEKLLNLGLVDRIAIPSERLIEFARKNNIKLNKNYTCCSVVSGLDI